MGFYHDWPMQSSSYPIRKKEENQGKSNSYKNSDPNYQDKC